MAATVILAVAAFAQSEWLNSAGKIGAEEVFSPNFDALAEYMGYDTDEKFEVFHKTAVFMGKYCTDEKSFSYIENMILSGCDAETTMDIYTFYMTTNEDISIVRKIYDKVYDGEKITNRDVVFENAFNEITNNKCGVLTEEKIENLLAKGVTVDDIMEANVLSRKGVLTIEEILNLRENGTKWDVIVEKITGEKIEFESDDDVAAVTYAMGISRVTNKSTEEILDESQEDLFDEITDNVNRQLKNKGYWKANKSDNYDTIVTKAKEKGIAEEKIEEMYEKGISEADLINVLNNNDCNAYNIDISIERQVEK